jgi:hypothetical protein
MLLSCRAIWGSAFSLSRLTYEPQLATYLANFVLAMQTQMDPEPMTVAGCADHVPGLGIGSMDIRGR